MGWKPMPRVMSEPRSSRLRGRAPVVRRQGACLPHWTQDGATYAVTFRLFDSLPATVLRRYAGERKEIVRRAEAAGRPLTEHEMSRLTVLFSERIEGYLDAGRGACWLRDPRIAALVRDAVLHFDGERYSIFVWTVMPNHVHVVLSVAHADDLARILHSWKSFTSNEANRLLGRSGTFWQQESYDHLVRDDEDLAHAIAYVLNNPAKAGLDGWPWVGRGSGYVGRAT